MTRNTRPRPGTSALGVPGTITSDPKSETQTRAIYEAFSVLENAAEWQRFLTDLCTPAELRALAARWQVAQMLDAGGLSYREISENTGASTTTVGRVARFLYEEPHQGYRLTLDRVRQKAKRP